MRPVYLRAPAYAHGELRSISCVPQLRSDGELLATLQAVGLDTFAQHDGPMDDLACDAVARTLECAGLSGPDIDAVIYASSLYARGQAVEPAYPSQLMGRVVRRLGLMRAIPHGVSFTPALQPEHPGFFRNGRTF